MAGLGLEIFGPYETYDKMRTPSSTRPGVRDGAVARAHTRPTRWNRAGSRRRCRDLHRRGAARIPRVARRRQIEATTHGGSFVSMTSRTTTSTVGARLRPFVKLIHFIGRDALEAIDPDSQRKKVTRVGTARTSAGSSLAAGDRESEPSSHPASANYGSSNSTRSSIRRIRRRRLDVHATAPMKKRALSPGHDRSSDRGGTSLSWSGVSRDGGSRKTTVSAPQADQACALSEPGSVPRPARLE